MTGGSVFFHPRFDATRDRARVNDEIKRVLVRDIAYNVAVRIRCSNGEFGTEYPLCRANIRCQGCAFIITLETSISGH